MFFFENLKIRSTYNVIHISLRTNCKDHFVVQVFPIFDQVTSSDVAVNILDTNVLTQNHNSKAARIHTFVLRIY